MNKRTNSLRTSTALVRYDACFGVGETAILEAHAAERVLRVLLHPGPEC